MNDPVTESRKQENLTDLAENEEVIETVEQANARRATNYLIAFGVFIAVIGQLVIEASK